jgi:hypothetical protein
MASVGVLARQQSRFVACLFSRNDYWRATSHPVFSAAYFPDFCSGEHMPTHSRLDKGKQKPAQGAQITAVRFTHAGYKWGLFAFLGVLFLLHSLALMVGVLSSLIHVAIQGVLLWLMVGNHRKVRLLVQTWCAVLIVSGLYLIGSRLLESEFTGLAMGKDLLVTALAIYFLVYSVKYIEDVTA